MIQRRRFIELIGAGLSLSLLLFRKRNAYPASARTEIMLDKVREPWSFAEFEFAKYIKTHRGPKLTTFPGYVIRLPRDVAEKSQAKDGLYVLSRICPHEGCPIKFYKDRSEVRQFLPVERFDHPMLVCTCHQSMFDPAENGKVIDGPAPRPPWVFDFDVEKGRIVIKDLEEGGEKWG